MSLLPIGISESKVTVNMPSASICVKSASAIVKEAVFTWLSLPRSATPNASKSSLSNRSSVLSLLKNIPKSYPSIETPNASVVPPDKSKPPLVGWPGMSV